MHTKCDWDGLVSSDTADTVQRSGMGVNQVFCRPVPAPVGDTDVLLLSLWPLGSVPMLDNGTVLSVRVIGSRDLVVEQLAYRE